MTPKLLSKEELAEAFKNVTVSNQPRAHWRDVIEAHIAALEADAMVQANDSLRVHILKLEQHISDLKKSLEDVRRKRESALADNAALVELLKDGRDSEESDDTWADRVIETLEQPHPGAALLEEHRKALADTEVSGYARCTDDMQKALVRARNEGLEKAAKHFDRLSAIADASSERAANAKVRLEYAEEAHRMRAHATTIRAMKEPEE